MIYTFLFVFLLAIGMIAWGAWPFYKDITLSFFEKLSDEQKVIYTECKNAIKQNKFKVDASSICNYEVTLQLTDGEVKMANNCIYITSAKEDDKFIVCQELNSYSLKRLIEAKVKDKVKNPVKYRQHSNQEEVKASINKLTSKLVIKHKMKGEI